MFRMVFNLILLGAGLASGQTCQTTEAIGKVNDALTKLLANTDISSVSISTASNDSVTRTFVEVACTIKETRTLMETIDTEVRRCLQLRYSTKVNTSLPKTLTDTWFDNSVFANLTDFCNCYNAWSYRAPLTGDASKLTTNVADAHYSTVIDMTAVCESDRQEALKAYANTGFKCPMLWNSTETIFKKMYVYKMGAYVLKGYCDNTDVNMTCAEDRSQSELLKVCLLPNNIQKGDVSDNKADSPQCRRRGCILDVLGDHCSASTALAYLWAVGIYHNYPDTEVELLDGCSGAETLMTPFIVIAMTSLLSILTS